jgi:hypothetical protein
VRNPDGDLLPADANSCYAFNLSSDAGTYTVTSTDASSGCTRTCTFTVSIDQGSCTPSCTNVALSCLTPTATRCYPNVGDCSFTLRNPGGNLVVPDANGCYSFGITSDVGTYTVTSTDASSGCTRTCTFTVSKDFTRPSCSALAIPNPLPDCGSALNALCVPVVAGVTYQWYLISPTPAGWSFTSRTDSNCVRYTAGSSSTDSVTISLVVTNTASGCKDSCTIKFPCRSPYWGCTPGFWKNHPVYWDQGNINNPPVDAVSSCIAMAIASITDVPPLYIYDGNGTIGSSFQLTFGLSNADMTAAGYPAGMTLLQGLNQGGGGYQKLARHGITALLNSCGLSGHYFYTDPVVVINMIHNAIVNRTPEPTATDFATHNEQKPDICPSGGGRATPKVHSRSGNTSLIADEFVTINAFPNPFNAKATIEFTFTMNVDKVLVEVYDMSGQHVATLFNDKADAGTIYQATFDGNNLTDGIYIYRINSGDNVYYDKLILIK